MKSSPWQVDGILIYQSFTHERFKHSRLQSSGFTSETHGREKGG